MKRRQFLTTACVAGLAAATMRTVTAAEPSGSPYFLDFRMITFSNAQRLETYAKHNGEVVIPAINRHGISPVGLFVADSNLNSGERNYDEKYDNVLFGLTPHPTFDSTQELAENMQGDAQYRESLAALSQGATSRNPLFTAHEQVLLRCFPEFPGVKVPSLDPNRILQLRMYRSHSFERNRAKITQYVIENGAIEVFLECGMRPVFFATTLFGAFMPSYFFMFSFESEEHIQDSWAKFRDHPNWHRLRDDPAYADTATEIISVLLRPVPGSQI